MVPCLREIGGRSKSKSAVYLYGLSRTETICRNLCIDSVYPSWIGINTEYSIL